MTFHARLSSFAFGVLALAPVQSGPTESSGAGGAPPGLVPIQGGLTRVGSDPAVIEALIRDHGVEPAALAGQTPMHTVRVDDFRLMVTEVTNEQYAAYLRATGARPPRTFGRDAIAAALRRQAKRDDEPHAAGDALAQAPFDEGQWWDANWRTASWTVPSELADHPVTFLSFEESLAYARWAGLRLMSEFEFQRAARGEGTDAFPWGDAWDKAMAASLESGRDGTWPVGSFPKGARNGVFDLAGNVWEWTSSPFVPYPDYQPLSFELGRGKQRKTVVALAAFDPELRVAVGGCYSNDAVALRVATRRDTAPSQRTAGLGFRCAASVQPGRDLAQGLLQRMTADGVLPQGVEYAGDEPTILQRWTSEAGAGPRPPGYRVITGYDALLFVPARAVGAASEKRLRAASAEEIQHFGILYTSVATLDPALETGAYAVAYRAAGKLPVSRGAAEPAWTRTPGFSPGRDSYLFFDEKGESVACVAAPPVVHERLKAGSVVLEAAPPGASSDVVRLRVCTAGDQRGKGFCFELAFAIARGVVDESWSSQ